MLHNIAKHINDICNVDERIYLDEDEVEDGHEFMVVRGKIELWWRGQISEIASWLYCYKFCSLIFFC